MTKSILLAAIASLTLVAAAALVLSILTTSIHGSCEGPLKRAEAVRCVRL